MRKIEAVIFDMDGVIIDSEKFWEKAEKKVFSSLGVKLTADLCQQTKSMTTNEVAQFWYNKYPWTRKTLEDVENEVVDYVGFLIEREGEAITGLRDVLEKLKDKGQKIGLATNSPYKLISVVLKKLDITAYFDIVSSAEHQIKGKPDPAIYISTAKKLNKKPENCLVFEDSLSGLSAAKSAGMEAVAILPEKEQQAEKFAIADLQINNFTQFDLEFLN